MIRHIVLLAGLAVAPGPVRDVQIHGFIDDSTYQLVHKQATSPGIRELDIYIDSPGGMVLAQNEIIGDLNVLRAAGVRVRCVVTGKAMSAAFTILQVCSERIGRPGTEYLVHEPRVRVEGDLTIRIAVQLAQHLLVDLEDMVGIIAPRMQLTPDQLGEMIADKELRMSADECLKMHGLDSVQLF